MVRVYKEKTNRQSLSTEAMNDVVDAVISGRCGSLKASNEFDVPQTTLERYINKEREIPSIWLIKLLGNFKPYLPKSRNLSL